MFRSGFFYGPDAIREKEFRPAAAHDFARRDGQRAEMPYFALVFREGGYQRRCVVHFGPSLSMVV
jgi:hypothetical protein